MWGIFPTTTTEMSGRLLLRCEKSFKNTINISSRTIILHAEICMYIYVNMVYMLSMWTCVQKRTSALQIGMAHAVWRSKVNFVSGARGTYATLRNDVRWGARCVNLKCFYTEYKI